MGRVSGPLMDRFDLRLEVPPVSFNDLDLPGSGEASATIADRVDRAQAIQSARYQGSEARLNADAEGAALEEIAAPDAEGKTLLVRAAEKAALSARGYHRVLRVARTVADLDGSEQVRRPHIAEALSFRLVNEAAS